MMQLTKRQVLVALAAIGAGAATGAYAQAPCPTVDISAGEAIGEAWLAAHPDADLSALRARLIPAGLCEDALAKLRSRAANDFRTGAIFIYRGWRISETEAQVFALLAAS